MSPNPYERSKRPLKLALQWPMIEQSKNPTSPHAHVTSPYTPTVTSSSSQNSPDLQKNCWSSSSSSTISNDDNPEEEPIQQHRKNHQQATVPFYRNPPLKIDVKQEQLIRRAIHRAFQAGVLSYAGEQDYFRALQKGESAMILEKLRHICHLRPVIRPVDYRRPTEMESRHSNSLMRCVNTLFPIQRPEELTKKYLIQEELQRSIDQWMSKVFPSAHSPVANLYVGGSWHLKVGLCDSDLDIVALVPHFVTKNMFFMSFRHHLQQHPEIRNVVAMQKAAAPLMTFTFNGVSIDFLYARYTEDVVPQNVPIHSDHILCGMDLGSVRSLSVPRVASLILELVPNANNFRACLRAIRLWAKQKGLYSNKAGFLGGISWTILVAFICQMFPNACVATLFYNFFSVLSTWNWPNPIMLARPYDAEFSCVQWNPQENIHDRAHVMPIITPGYPATNSAVNVSNATLQIIKEEFGKTKRIMDEIAFRPYYSLMNWETIFALSDFYVRYDHYIEINLEASDYDKLAEWSNYVLSRIRKLIGTLDETDGISIVQPNPKLAGKRRGSKGETASKGTFYIGLEVDKDYLQPILASVDLVMRYFKATELDTYELKEEGMISSVVCCEWSHLPENLFIGGKKAAAGERAKFMLRKAHNIHMSSTFLTPFM